MWATEKELWSQFVSSGHFSSSLCLSTLSVVAILSILGRPHDSWNTDVSHVLNLVDLYTPIDHLLSIFSSPISSVSSPWNSQHHSITFHLICLNSPLACCCNYPRFWCICCNRKKMACISLLFVILVYSSFQICVVAVWRFFYHFHSSVHF